jgi:molybdenum cofactor cytidylyltransferase
LNHWCNAFISALVLAAGESRRMGNAKLMLPLDKNSILDKTISNVLYSYLDEVVVVIGYRSDDFLKKINKKNIKVVLNPNFKEGISSSIIAGLTCISQKSHAIMIILADQPFISSYIINKMLIKFKESKKGILVPSYNNMQGHPVIFSLKYKEELLKLKGDVGGKEIIKRFPWDVLEIPIHSKNIHIDIDTPEDYKKYKN